MFIRLVLYFGAEVLMVAALLSYSVSAGIFGIGFLVWVDLFVADLVRALRGSTYASRHSANR